MTDLMLPEICSVENVSRELGDTVSFDLKTESGEKIQGQPGQFNMLYVFGQGEVPISISGDCSEQSFCKHTVRSVGAVSEALCQLKDGDQIGFRGPFGTTWPIEKCKGKDILFIGGGLGLAPLRPAIYHYLNNAKDFNKASLLYGTKNVEGILYPDELDEWEKKSDLNIFVTIDQATKECPWNGHVGVVTTLIDEADFDPANTIAMVCGPEIMMRFVAKNLIDRGMDEEDVFISMERNMKCAIGHCGHCQLGSEFICKDGPVFTYKRMKKYLTVREL